MPISQDRLGSAMVTNSHTNHHPEFPQINQNVFLVLIILQFQISCIFVSHLTLVTQTGESHLQHLTLKVIWQISDTSAHNSLNATRHPALPNAKRIKGYNPAVHPQYVVNNTARNFEHTVHAVNVNREEELQKYILQLC